MGNEKHLKFSSDLVPLVLSGEKTVTWRIDDDKDLQAGDVVMLLAQPDFKIFAKGVIDFVVIKTMGDIEESDFDGHERFANHEEMLKVYSRYYDKDVNDDTHVKIVKFTLLEKFSS